MGDEWLRTQEVGGGLAMKDGSHSGRFLTPIQPSCFCSVVVGGLLTSFARVRPPRDTPC